MPLTFYLVALLVTASAVAAMSLRNLVHCAMALALAFVGLAALYLQLNAQFVGLVQVLVYVGAVAILIVFAILLTRGGDSVEAPRQRLGTWIGLAVAGLVCGVIAGGVVTTRLLVGVSAKVPDAKVREIGMELMTRYVLPLQVLALLLTAALIGAVLIALPEKFHRKEGPKP